MAKLNIFESFVTTPSFIERVALTSREKRETGEKEFGVENRLTRRNSQSKGKKMMEIKNTSIELKDRLKNLENRVNYIEGEQIKAQRNIVIAKRSYEKYYEIRKIAEESKNLKTVFKEKQQRELSENTKKNLELKKMQQEKIKLQKEIRIKRNQDIKNAMKHEISLAEALVEQRKLENLENLQRNACYMSKLSKTMIEKRNLRYQSLKAMKEEEYHKKMEIEMEKQRQTLKKIVELENLEETLLDNLHNSEDFQDFVSADLLTCHASPTDLSKMHFY